MGPRPRHPPVRAQAAKAEQPARLGEDCVDGRLTEVAPGVVLHHVLSPPSDGSSSGRQSGRPLLVHCAHGFGANALTWAPLFGSLRSALASQAPSTPVTLSAHDTLGFGLSPRPKQIEQYGQTAGAAFALRLLAAVLDATTSSPPPLRPPAISALKDGGGVGVGVDRRNSPKSIMNRPGDSSTETGSDSETGSDDGQPQQNISPLPPSIASTAAESDIVLMGHSLGGALTARMLCQAFSGAGPVSMPRGLVLIAPALIAPSTASSSSSSSSSTDVDGTAAAKPSGMWMPMPVLAAIGATYGLITLCTQLFLRLVISCMIYSQAFWRNGLSGAYYDPRKLTDEMIRCYRWPAQVRGADRGVANFCLAQFAAMRYEMRARLRRRRAAREPAEVAAQAPVMSDAEVVATLKTARVPILIIHGVHDRIVPLSNSRRLVERLGGEENGVTLLEVEDAGHCPQEEAYEEVSEAVSQFVGVCCA